MVIRKLVALILAAVVNAAIELPDCPTGIQYLPQSLPMHCKLPKDFQQKLATLPPVPKFPNDYFPTLPPGQQLQGIPMGPMAPMPGLPLPMAVPAPNLPVIVMPIYRPSKESKKKKRERTTIRPSDSDCSSDKDSCAQEDKDKDNYSGDYKRERRIEDFYDKKHGRAGEYTPERSSKKSKKEKDFYRRSGPITIDNDDELTPILQYVSKDGYVIYEKELTESEEDDWLDAGMTDPLDTANSGKDAVTVTTVAPTTEKVSGRMFRMLAKTKEKKKLT